MKIFQVVTWNKSVVYLLFFIKECILDLLTIFYKRLSKQFFVFAGKQLRNCLAYLTDLRINGISEQDALRKFTVDICIQVRVPSKKKTREIQGPDIFFLVHQTDRIRWGAPFIIKLSVSYVSIAVWNKLAQGEPTLRPFRSLVFFS